MKSNIGNTPKRLTSKVSVRSGILDFIGWPSTAPAPVGKAGVGQWLIDAQKNGSKLDYELRPAAVQIFGNVAVTYYTAVQHWSGSSATPATIKTGRTTHTWMRTGDSWLIIGGMAAALPAEQATAATAEIERQIVDNERVIAVAFLRHDQSAAERFFADDFREIVPSGRIFTKADIVRQAANSDFIQMDIFEPSVYVVNPDVAIYTARYVETRKQSPTAEPVSRNVRLFVVWVLRNGKWQIVAGQNRPIT